MQPGWDTNFNQRIVAPPAVRLEFQASPKWFANNPGVMDVVGDQILRKNEGLILNWIQGQRQNARNSGLMQWMSQYLLPQMVVTYVRQFGYETIRIVALPENAGGRVPTTVHIPLGDELEVNPKFIGYPIPGAEGLQGDISGGCAWWDGQEYFYEFASTPGWPTDEYADTPLIRNSEPFNIDKIIFPDLLVFQEFGHFFTDFDNSPSGQHGFAPNLWQHIGAGSKLFPTPIKDGDMAYFEVSIDKLNTSVPDSCSTTQGDPGNPLDFLDNELVHWDSGIHTRFYPKELNTWWTPAIGILPESMVSKDSKGTVKNSTPALLGMELDMTAPRSIYTVRTSYMTIHTHSQVFQLGAGYYGVPVDPVHGGVVNFPQDPTFDGPFVGTVQQYNPTFERITLPGDFVYGLPENFDIVVHYQAPYLQEDDTEELAGDILQTGFTGDPTTDALVHSMPLHATDGVYSPCLKGRADNRITPLPSDDYPLQTDVDAFNGVFSGVELGEWQEGDIIRVAVDAKNGYVWFGRNDHWYYMQDQVSVQADRSDDPPGKTTNWALVLDKDPATGKYPNYYAAVSWRVGGMKATLKAGSTQKYPAPAGFTRLTVIPELTIPGPFKDPIV